MAGNDVTQTRPYLGCMSMLDLDSPLVKRAGLLFDSVAGLGAFSTDERLADSLRSLGLLWDLTSIAEITPVDIAHGIASAITANRTGRSTSSSDELDEAALEDGVSRQLAVVTQAQLATAVVVPLVTTVRLAPAASVT